MAAPEPWRAPCPLPRLPRVIGHRGAAGRAPENTLASIARAAALGAAWVEFDVKLTRDRVPVLFHDDTLERTTGERGRVADTTYARIRGLDAGRTFGTPAPVPTLDEAVACLAAHDLGANVEIKPCPGREVETARIVVERLAREWPPALPPPLVSSFAWRCLEVARAIAPELPRGLLAGRLPLRWRAAAARLGCASVHLDHERLTARGAASVKAAGLRLLAYTVNDAARARTLFAAGVDAVFTDLPDLILPVAG